MYGYRSSVTTNKYKLIKEPSGTQIHIENKPSGIIKSHQSCT